MNITDRLNVIENGWKPKIILYQERIFRKILPDGAIYYYNEKNEIHNVNDEPALIYKSGTKIWCKNDQYHRDNGLPAVIWSDGREEYWVDGERVK